jgi:hypothetical protein
MKLVECHNPAVYMKKHNLEYEGLNIFDELLMIFIAEYEAYNKK